MSNRIPFRKLAKLWRQWCDAREGNVTILFAFALIPVFALTGAAIDYSRATAIRTSMQAAADSAALAVSLDATKLSKTEITSKATAHFLASFDRPELPTPPTVTADYDNTNGSTLKVTATAFMPTSFMGVIGINSMTLGASSTTRWGTNRLRIALALDTTGSMSSDGKIDALKTATASLLDQLKAAATNNGDVYVSIVPFSKNVNVGAGNHSASWIDWTDWEAEPAILQSSKPNNWDDIGPGSDCPFSNSSHGFRCAANPTSTSIVSSIPSSGTYSGYICPSTDTGQKSSTRIGLMYNGCYTSVAKPPKVVASGSSASCGSLPNCTCSGNGSNRKCTQTYPGKYDHTWIKNAHSTWNGCVTDRGTTSAPSQNYDRLVTAPGSSAASKFPAEQNAYCSPAAMGLSYNWTDMKSLASNLYPLGATNQPIGLVWAWQTLVGGGPFTMPAKDANYTYQEAIILMSDGMNTLNRWYGNGSSTNTSVDKRMYDTDGTGTCKNIKDSGVTIYTIHVNTDGDPTSQLLKNCASTQDKFWTVTSAGKLGEVFQKIGDDLAKLRIAK